MEPVTHILTSLAIVRAAQKRLPRFGTRMIVLAGVAADLDFASYLGGPESFLRFHRTALHSLLGSALMACVIAWAFTIASKRIPTKVVPASNPAPPLLFASALTVCATGEQLFREFHSEWFAWDLLANLDPWILLVLLARLLLPLLFRLIGDEIGDRKKKAS